MPSTARRHPAQTLRTGVRRALDGLSLAERLLLTAVATAFLLTGLSGVGGTYARWADGASAEGATLTTGTAALGARWTDEGQDSVWQNLLPGESAVRELTLENTGAVPLEVTTTLADGAPSLEILAGGAPVRLEPGQHLTFPVELAATEHLHPGDEIAVEVLLEGRQIR